MSATPAIPTAAVAGFRRPPGRPLVPERDDGAAGAPAPARGVELLGEVAGSGYRRPPALVRRMDGQTIQLTPLLYKLLEAIDGKRDYHELAALLSERVGKLATADDVRFLTEARLRPLGLLRQPDGSEPTAEKANPLLALSLKLVVTDPTVTRHLTAPFTALFRPPVVLALLAAFAAATGWIAFEKGMASAAHQALYEPGLLMLVFALTLLSAGFHELGHAAACRYGGARPGVMGVGLYLVWPAFYTDVTDSYRLSRAGRLRVDLGGLYFNAVFAVAMFALWAAVRWDALLLVIGVQVLQMIRQLLPVVRFDGYHILADLTGVPDLFLHVKPTLLGLLPTRWRSSEGKALKPWARAVVTLWVLIVVPLLAAVLVMVVMVLPRLVATAWDSLGQQWEALGASQAQGDYSAVGARALSVFALCIPLLSVLYLLARIVRRTTRRVWRATAGRPRLRALSAAAAAALLAAVAWAWWPNGQYRPIDADEGWSLAASFQPVAPQPDVGQVVVDPAALQTLEPRMASAQPGGLTAPAAPAARPRLALVLVPRGASGADRASASPVLLVPSRAKPGSGVQAPAGWAFPFDPPRKPRAGDNQALAVNTKDGATVYDVALALVWVTDGGPVEQRNEAYALASCTGCRTVAVAFQVILIVGRAEVVTPVNAAVAVNHACRNCVTHALAVQLIATITELPDEQVMAELSRAWAKLEQLSGNVDVLPLEQVYADLVAVETEILEILARGGGAAAPETSVAQDGGVGAGTSTVPASPEPATEEVASGATEEQPASETTTTAETTSPVEEASETGTTTATGDETGSTAGDETGTAPDGETTTTDDGTTTDESTGGAAETVPTTTTGSG